MEEMKLKEKYLTDKSSLREIEITVLWDYLISYGRKFFDSEIHEVNMVKNIENEEKTLDGLKNAISILTNNGIDPL